jgi:hemerythrin
MVLVEWSKSLSVDIKVIDGQHKKLLGYMNSFYDALNQGKEKDVLIKLFNDLDDYTKTHFLVEEKYFEKFNYKEKEGHILQHREFIRRLIQMKKQIPEDLMDTEDLLTFLVDWLMNHIKISDHKYMDCFHQQGIY